MTTLAAAALDAGLPSDNCHGLRVFDGLVPSPLIARAGLVCVPIGQPVKARRPEFCIPRAAALRHFDQAKGFALVDGRPDSMTVDTKFLEVDVRDRQPAVVGAAMICKLYFNAGQNPVARKTEHSIRRAAKEINRSRGELTRELFVFLATAYVQSPLTQAAFHMAARIATPSAATSRSMASEGIPFRRRFSA